MTRLLSLCLGLAVLASTGCESASESAANTQDAGSNARSQFAGLSLYVDPDSAAADQADLWRTSDPAAAAVMDQLAAQPLSLWLGDWMDDVEDEVDDALDDAGDALRSFVVYNIPDRDCGSFSAGGADEAPEYEAFIDGIADGLAGRQAIVILEPDGLALTDCLDADADAERLELMSDAVDVLSGAGASVYLDAGDSAWIPADDMAERLDGAGVDRAAGFALNVSHTEYTADEVAYAEELRAILGTGARYVVDTGRNGVGPAVDHEWCNPLDREVGRSPTLSVRRAGLDALLWIKKPGHSDGYCNGGPEAGDWWPEYALDLAD